ncbi:hypothetical protein [Streptosporangium sandarakinum]|uniref:hypothetical protein n=1 Tax=Streptosporangium sandarakinum TaxID=1260955 RepID=UPI003446658E
MTQLTQGPPLAVRVEFGLGGERGDRVLRPGHGGQPGEGLGIAGAGGGRLQGLQEPLDSGLDRRSGRRAGGGVDGPGKAATDTASSWQTM